jgi:uncharacterized spore protein YtfJ
VESATTQQISGLKLKNYVFNGTGTTLPSTVVASSLTTVGKLTNLLVGTGADFTRYANAKVVLSQTNTSHTHTNNTGVVGEAVADSIDTTKWGVGVYGRGNTNVGTRSSGVLGDGGVTSSSDTASAIGVRGYADDTHASGLNIGLYSSATNSSVGNYALYMNAGNIYSGVAQTWTTSGTVTFIGPYAIGYGTGAGGSVTQGTNRTQGVTINAPTGAITLFTAAGSITPSTFTVTNSQVAATDTIMLNVKSSTNVYLTFVTAVAAGSFNITFYTTGGTSSDAPVFNFSVFKAVTA